MTRRKSQIVRALTCGAVLSLMACPALFAQFQASLIDLSPPDAADSDTVTFKTSGTWPNVCVPQSPVVSVSAGSVRVSTTSPGLVCPQALTPWSLSGTIGKLQPGRYDLVFEFSSPSVNPPVEWGRRTLTVVDSSQLNEVILPTVVNGAVAEGLHYQTIFTILNASSGDVQGTLQVFNNSGTARGVFCSPLAPPPSSALLTLSPNGQYFQFTSADLAFLNGWARLRWQGSTSVLVSEELTLVATAPAPCQLVCNRPSTEKLASGQITAVKAAKQFKMPITINPNRQTAVALINPSSSEPATVRVSILDSQGTSAQLGVPNSFEVRVGPLERISKFVWELANAQSPQASVPTPPTSFQGSLVFSSDVPFVASGLQIMFPEGKFVADPVVSTP